MKGLTIMTATIIANEVRVHVSAVVTRGNLTESVELLPFVILRSTYDYADLPAIAEVVAFNIARTGQAGTTFAVSLTCEGAAIYVRAYEVTPDGLADDVTVSDR